MNNNSKITVLLVLVLIIYIYLLIRTPNYIYNGPSVPSTVQTASFDTLKMVCKDKLKLVKEKSGLLSPYNKLLMDQVQNAIENATEIKQLALASLLMPNNCIDLAPIYPQTDPLDSTLFQFEQGNIGWYWGYATYINPIANIMYYIVRIELGSPTIREKYNLPLGSTTVYSISLGIGNNGNWNYSPYIICQGKYEIFSKTNFRFTANFDTGYTVFQTTDNIGEFKLDMGWNPATTTIQPTTGPTFMFNSSTVFSSQYPTKPSFNGKGGCSPCISGAGTLYWSYTQFTTQSTLSIPSGTLNLTNGDGWLDHQWLRGNDPQQLIIKLLNNIKQLSSFTGGLGRYMWINLHIPKGSNGTPIQYMISCFPDSNQTISEGLSFSTIYNIYSNYYDNNSLNQTGNLQILKTTTINNIVFPTVVLVEVVDFQGSNYKYTVDTTPFGNCVTIDMTSNLHWSGSAILNDTNQTPIGTAFLEANQFQDPVVYRQNIIKQGNFNPSLQDAYNQKGAIKPVQIIPTIIVLILPIVLTIMIIIFYRKSKK
jgi:hypothetical protein